MLKIKRKAQLNKLINSQTFEKNNQKKSTIAKWIEIQLSSFSYSLTDENADFYINNVLREQDKIITVEMYVRPKRGIFQQIEFRPKIYFSSVDLVKRPKIYNDRRIFHPNINVETFEIIFPQLVLQWNPTKKYFFMQNRLETLIKSLKYILIEPNIGFVPNTELNRKAGVWYHFRRAQYRQIIFENMPMSFELIFNKDDKQKMQLESGSINQQKPCKVQKQWFDVKSLYPFRMLNSKSKEPQQNCQFKVNKKSLQDKDWKDEDEIKILAKQMKKVHVFSDTESEPIMELQS